MSVPQWYKDFDDTLAGETDHALTAILVGLAVLILLIAFLAPRPVKLAVAAWVILP